MIQELQSIPKRALPIIFVIDTSGSMEGERIACLNTAMISALDKLRERASDDAYYDIRIAVLQFDRSVRWVTGDKLIPLEDYCWEDLEASGMTNMGNALRELSDKLRRERLFKDCENGVLLSCIFFITDGAPADDWKSALKGANDNPWFKKSLKLFIGIGDDTDKEVLIEIIGDEERFLLAKDNSEIQSCVLEAIKIFKIICSYAGWVSKPIIGANPVVDSEPLPPPDENNDIDWSNYDW